jgi:hypothetical protein
LQVFSQCIFLRLRPASKLSKPRLTIALAYTSYGKSEEAACYNPIAKIVIAVCRAQVGRLHESTLRVGADHDNKSRHSSGAGGSLKRKRTAKRLPGARLAPGERSEPRHITSGVQACRSVEQLRMRRLFGPTPLGGRGFRRSAIQPLLPWLLRNLAGPLCVSSSMKWQNQSARHAAKSHGLAMMLGGCLIVLLGTAATCYYPSMTDVEALSDTARERILVMKLR